MLKFLCLCVAIFAAPMAALAEQIAYRLDAARSQVAYEVAFDKDIIRGQIPISSAEVRIDFAGGPSSVRVTLNAAGATSSFPFAEQALKGPKVLATARYPQMTFVADGFRVGRTTAQVPGQVTIRGVTRPVTLSAQLYRQQGTEAGDLSKMSVHMSGAVSRADFGATGWADMVADTVRIDIVARLDRI